jgi:hypothetical protein
LRAGARLGASRGSVACPCGSRWTWVRCSGRLRHCPECTYGRDVSPVANERLARALRGLLDRKGVGTTELWNTEWQAGDFLRAHLGVDQERARRATPRERAAFAVGMATYAISCKLRWQGLVAGSYLQSIA